MNRASFILLILVSTIVFGQNRQGNTIGAELFADAPYRIERYDSLGNANPLPIHVFCHEASGFGSNYEINNIRISIKNSTDSTFGDPISFFAYSDSLFYDLFSDYSVDNTTLNIQEFDLQGAVKDLNYTINFISDGNSVDITKDYWYFTFSIPGNLLNNYNNIVDIKVYFDLAWEADIQCYLRVFRSDSPLPSLNNWYRGDTHYHTMFTSNTAEIGLPLKATKTAAKAIGLDWITATDHSCDYDNYGVSITENWSAIQDSCSLLNTQDSSFIWIPGIEMSVDNSAGEVVHSLIYPDPNNIYELKFPGDGGGDEYETDINVDMLLDSLQKYDAFCYMAHPFAEGDKLSELIGGNVWNIGDSIFPENGEPYPNYGSIICNNPENTSDIYSENVNQLFKHNLLGGQVWNLRNERTTTDDIDNAWSVLYDDNTEAFTQIDSLDDLWHLNRFIQNMDIMNYLWQKGLTEKNQNHTIQNWKLFISAGSDAHGSYNYSTTDLFYGVSGAITDNACGKLSTLVYCPEGMGVNGKNILKALKQGNSILSSGPIVRMELSDAYQQIIPGMDTTFESNNYDALTLEIEALTSNEFGEVENIIFHLYSEDSIYTIQLPAVEGIQEFTFGSFLNDNQIPIEQNKYYMLRAELITRKEYDSLAVIYSMPVERFRSYTNPIWFNISNPVSNFTKSKDDNIRIYPCPASDRIYIESNHANVFNVKLTDIFGKKLVNKKDVNELDISCLPKGLYIILIDYDSKSTVRKIIKQ